MTDVGTTGKKWYLAIYIKDDFIFNKVDCPR